MHAPMLRPLNVGEILDRSFALYRSQFAPLLGTALTLYLPLAMMSAIFGVAAASGSDAALAGGGILVLLIAPMMLIGVVLSVAALTYQTSRAYMGHPATVGEAVRHGFARFFPLALAMILTGIAIFLGLFGLLIGALIVYVLLFAVVPAVVIERRGPLSALQRSAELAEGDWWRICAVVVVAGLIATLPSMVVELMLASAAGADDPMSQGFVSALGALVNALTYPFSVAATVILYYDRRVRAEGLDVELMAATAPVPA
ncbi:MAG TPA: hypothetical protein VGB66_05630 [Longimicrobium sp.]